MRLINTDTLELKEFPEDALPPYVILSHVWYDEVDECHFQEFIGFTDHTAETKNKKGYAKIVNFCRQCRAEGFDWAWADTVCINKASYEELNSAINSMFEWYRRSEVCFAYLEDTKRPKQTTLFSSGQLLFRELIEDCQWFKRGWTLQELIASRTIRFFSRTWTCIATNYQAVEDIADITGIPKDVVYQLKDSPFTLKSYWPWRQYTPCSVLKWASRRTVRRPEDAAYSLLGLFNVRMNINYGEGAKAFERLQSLIMVQTGNLCILSWKSDKWASENTVQIGLCTLLSPSISVFKSHYLRRTPTDGWQKDDPDRHAERQFSFRESLEGEGGTVARSLVETLNAHFYLARLSYRRASTASHESLIPLFTETGNLFHRVCLPIVETSFLAIESVCGELPTRDIRLGSPPYTSHTLLRNPEFCDSECSLAHLGNPHGSKHYALVVFPYGNMGFSLSAAYPAIQLPYGYPGVIPLQSDDGQEIHHGIIVLQNGHSQPSRHVAIFLAFYVQGGRGYDAAKKVTGRVLQDLEDASPANLAHISRTQAQELQIIPEDDENIVVENIEYDLLQWRNYDEREGIAIQLDCFEGWYGGFGRQNLIAQVVFNVEEREPDQFE